MVETKFYETFGVSPKASIDEIKKAYKKLAMKYHPDKNRGDEAAAEKFKEISYQFSVLEDPKKRQIYDQYGEKGVKEGGGGGGDFSANDIFSRFFNMGSDDSSHGRRGQDMTHELKLSLEDLYVGVTKKLSCKRNILCEGCEGKGGSNVMKCNDCGGKGKKVQLHQIGPGMVQQFVTECKFCQGSGEKISEEDKCKTCRGNKIYANKKILEVVVPPGTKSGYKVVFEGEGDQEPGITTGDIVFVITEKKHPLFQRIGLDLVIEMKILLVEALTGFQKSITHLDGRKLLVTSSNGDVIKEGCIKAIKNEGMPNSKHRNLKGRLLIKFSVIFPDRIDVSLIPQLKAALGQQADTLCEPMSSDDVEEVVLENVDSNSFSNQQDDDSDDHDHHHQQRGGGGGVQCAQQ